LSQRAYRQRQIDTIERLENVVAALRSATQDISKVSINLGHAELDQAVERALKLVGREPAKAVESFQQSGAHIQPKSNFTTNLGSHSSLHVFSDGFVADPKGISPARQPTSTLDGQHPPKIDLATAASAQAEDVPWREELPERGYSGGRMSPRLTYGLWFEPDRFMQLSHAPPDLMPYLGDGERTFAGMLFWGTSELGCWLLNYHTTTARRLNPGLAGSWGSATLVQAIFGMYFGIVQPESVIKCIRAKLELRKHGIMDMYDHDAVARLRHLVSQEVVRRVDSVRNYLGVLEVADYIRQRCVDGTLEGLDGAARNQDGIWSTTFVSELVKQLALQSVMFGDGPRFRVDAVNEILRTSLAESLARPSV
jgi:hypothetical protein